MDGRSIIAQPVIPSGWIMAGTRCPPHGKMCWRVSIPIAEQGEIIVGQSSASGRCDSEHIEQKKRAWFRLEPGQSPLCAKSTEPFQGAWRIHHGSSGFY